MKKITLFMAALAPFVILFITREFGQPEYGVSSLYKIIYFLPFLYYWYFYKKDLRAAFFEKISWKATKKYFPETLAIALALAAICFFGFLALQDSVAWGKIRFSAEVTIGITPENIIAISLFIIILNGLLEEFFWRRFLFNELQTQMGSVAAHSITVIAFVGLHALFFWLWFSPLQLVIAILALAIFTVIMNFYFQRTQDLLSCWLIHAAVDIVQMGIALHVFGVI